MYNLRYHLVSLVAVFLALAVGLVLGSVVAERGYLDEQQSALVEGLRQDFAELRAENERLRAAYELDRGFALETADALIEGALEGRRIAIITNEGRTEGLSAVTSAVEDAGGDAVIVMVSEPGLGLGSTALRDELRAAVTTGVGLPLQERTALSIADEWTSAAGDDPVTAALVDRGVLELRGWDAAMPLDGAVLLAVWNGEPDESLVETAVRLQELGASVVGAETQRYETGVVEAAREAGLSAVDNVGSAEGGFSLVWILTGRAEGHFGIGEDAAPFPDVGPVDVGPAVPVTETAG